MRRSILVFSLLLVPALAAWIKFPPASTSATETARAEAAILGLWSRFQPDKEGDLQRFYYFHKGGIGLFRYGRMGLTYTQTFRYDVDDRKLRLVFNKGGEAFDVQYSLNGDVLTFVQDPRMGGEQSYTKRHPPVSTDIEAFNHPMARLWTQQISDGTENVGFRMYQLQAPTIDGRGVGWYHEGDFAEWSTETLEYRRTGDRLALFFPVRNERHVTDIKEGTDGGVRTLALTEDPRNFWHPRTYRDGGPGFTMMVAGGPLPYHVPGHGAYRAHGCPHGR